MVFPQRQEYEVAKASRKSRAWSTEAHGLSGLFQVAS